MSFLDLQDLDIQKQNLTNQKSHFTEALKNKGLCIHTKVKFNFESYVMRHADQKLIQLAKNLFLKDVSQKEIAEAVGRSERTIANWVNKYNWRELRAAYAVSAETLLPKILAKIDTLLSAEEFDAKSADKLSKLNKTLEGLQGNISIFEITDTFLTFHAWLVNRQKVDASITDEVIKLINSLQNQYVQERITHGK